MLVTRDWLGAPADGKPGVVMTVGVFDGLHLGHRHLIGQVVARAKKRGALSLVITFEPHPMAVLSPGTAPEILTTFDQKVEILGSMGLDRLGCLEFDEKLRGLSAVEFLDEAVGSRLSPLEIVIGPDFRFGRDAEGGLGTLRQWARGRRVAVTPVRRQVGGGQLDYSSSHVRSLLKIGLVDSAALVLGRPYRLSGEVVSGAARGRDLGFPTANLGDVAQLVPGPGVYAVRATLRGVSRPGMTSIGQNPTFGARYLTVETFLFDFSDDFYGERLDIDFVAHLRGMVRFEGPARLVEQLKADELAAREILGFEM
ncbi:MAG: riboflavin biosynthesis protein RibF [Deltaproteobacteria bacterium]|jgi:riboflavin kinase/FMN adenylyltransferase|nr:riboflavin biosynthesis protein RibF [Deltaproteobacteria bacterium]